MRSVVLMSGGIDSTVALAELLDAGHECIGIGFDYGQAAAGNELTASLRVAGHYQIPYIHPTITNSVAFVANALTGGAEMPVGHAEVKDATCVPGRNLVLLAMAHSFAMVHGAHQLVFGAIVDGRAGYADCRPDFIQAMDEAISLSSSDATPLRLHAPFQSWSKAQVLELGVKLGVPMHLCWSCYTGSDEPCGTCGACDLRAKGLAAAGVTL